MTSLQLWRHKTSDIRMAFVQTKLFARKNIQAMQMYSGESAYGEHRIAWPLIVLKQPVAGFAKHHTCAVHVEWHYAFRVCIMQSKPLLCFMLSANNFFWGLNARYRNPETLQRFLPQHGSRSLCLSSLPLLHVCTINTVHMHSFHFSGNHKSDFTCVKTECLTIIRELTGLSDTVRVSTIKKNLIYSPYWQMVDWLIVGFNAVTQCRRWGAP